MQLLCYCGDVNFSLNTLNDYQNDLTFCCKSEGILLVDSAISKEKKGIRLLINCFLHILEHIKDK